ncbi:ankyrin repeat-containing domain protein [Xylogone sp. PMI_703]|nr:ankyrin repeat-containing domain protein [Xylogone sp. PMI_703]
MSEDQSKAGEDALPDIVIEQSSTYNSADYTFDIVAVHGFHSQGKEVWKGAEKQSWLADVATENSWNARVLQYYYDPKKITASLYTRNAIRREALTLLEKLTELRQKNENNQLPGLAFIAHDVGGLIVKEALVIAGQSGNGYAEIKFSHLTLIFLGYPHQSASAQHMETNIARFLFAGDDLNPTVNEIKSLANTFITVNGAFLQTGVPTRANIFSIRSTEQPLREMVFDNSTTLLRVPYEQSYGLKVSHNGLSQYYDDEVYKARIVQTMNRVISSSWYPAQVLPVIEAIESQASPAYPQITVSDNLGKFDSLSQNEALQKWLDNDYGISFLHIRESLDTSGIAKYALEKIIDQPRDNFRAILYYQFNKYDVRRNSIGSMANTFLSQLFNNCRKTDAPLLGDYQPPDFDECWTDTDAFVFLNKTRMALGSAGRSTWIIESLDQCDESYLLLLSELRDMVISSEQHFKVLITSSENEKIDAALSTFPPSAFPSIDIQKLIKGSNPKESNSSEEAHLTYDAELLKEVLYISPPSSSYEEEIRNILRDCGCDDQLRHILLEWLIDIKSIRGLNKAAQELKLLSPPSPSRTYERILETVSDDKQPWARKVLQWVLTCSRPLAPEELETAIALDGSAESFTAMPILDSGIVRQLHDCFGPLLIVENGAIQLSHPLGRQCFLSANSSPNEDRPWYVLDAPEERHRYILDILTSYLELPDVQDQIVTACKTAPNSQPKLAGQPDLTAYGIQYLSYHYHLGYPKTTDLQLHDELSRFFRNKDALRIWAAANWYFSNPLLRPDRSFLFPTPILASLGLEKEVTSTLEKENLKEKPGEYDDLDLALIEAARHGHITVVQNLINRRSVKPAVYYEAVLAASRTGKTDAIKQLIGYLTKFEENAWQGFLTSRVAFFSSASLLKSVLDKGAIASPTVAAHYSPPLLSAIMVKSLSAFNVLMEYYVDHLSPNDNWKDSLPLIAAVKFGNDDMIGKLIRAGIQIEASETTGRTAAWWAAATGRPNALKALIDAGCDKRSFTESFLKDSDYPIFITPARAPFPKCLKLLINYGIDVNLKTDFYPNSALGYAASKGNAEICRLLLESGAKANGTETERPIILAAQSGNRECINMLLEYGAEIDVGVEYDGGRPTPLRKAAEYGLVNMVKHLLEKKADANFTALTTTPIFDAIQSGSIEIIKLLIEAGADVNYEGLDYKWRPLHYAYKNIEALEVLLDAGADIDSVCQDGTALYLATFFNCNDSVKLLASRGANLELPWGSRNLWDDGYNALHAAATQGYVDIMRTLLDFGANPNATIPNGMTPLMNAVLKSKENSVKVLLEYACNLDAVDEDEDSVMHIEQLPVSTVKLLIQRGVDIELRDKRGHTALCVAVRSNNVPLVEFLLEKKAKINVPGSPLNLAVKLSNRILFDLLVEKGGDINMVADGISGTPLQTALYKLAWSDTPEINEMADYLVDHPSVDVNIHCGYMGSAINMAMLCGTFAHCKRLVERGADVLWTDNYGRQTIHYASLKTLDHFQLLLNAGADLKIKDKLGQSPLHLAVSSGKLDLVQLVISRSRGSIEDPDIDGWTPLLSACRPSGAWGAPADVQFSIIELLISHGANIWTRGKTGEEEWSPLKMAKRHGACREIVELLTPKKGSRRSSNPNGEGQLWDDSFHTCKKALYSRGFCDVCLLGVFGSFHNCLECVDSFWLCFKCYPRRKVHHPQHDNWELRGEDNEVDEEEDQTDEVPTDVESPLAVEKVQDDDDTNWSESDNDND